MPFRAPSDRAARRRPGLDELLDRVARETDRAASPCSCGSAALRRGRAADATAAERELADGAPGLGARRTPTWRRSSRPSRRRAPRLAELRRDDARLTLATAHSTKGAEFDHVAVVGMEEGRFPSGRAVAEADDPVRALEEERRLGYVAWTRARRTLTLSYDPAVPSPFLLEAFSPDELGLSPRRRPVELADEPVDRLEERLGQLGRAARRGPSPSAP